ncbi:hypothetical protein BGZ76_008948 [Entomortierella beljakovae]|nr:hypothetical protein BGZ76_008948 [Entomortierella beljakovae]
MLRRLTPTATNSRLWRTTFVRPICSAELGLATQGSSSMRLQFDTTTKRSLFKYSRLDSKSTATKQSTSFFSTSSARSASPGTNPTVAARDSGSRVKRSSGSNPNFSRVLADLCAKQDVPFYLPPPTLNKTFTLAYLAAGLQFIFWGNIAQYAFTHYTDDPIFTSTPPPLPLPGTEGVESVDVPLAPLRKRIIITAGLIGTGVVIAFGICAIPWRYVTRLTILRGGTQIKIETGRKIPQGYHRIYPIQDMQCRQQLVTNIGPQGTMPLKDGNSMHVMLGSKKERMAFFVDRRGSFRDPALWDSIFHKPYKN